MVCEADVLYFWGFAILLQIMNVFSLIVDENFRILLSYLY